MDTRHDTSFEDPGVRLMLAYQAGDESAFDELVESYSGPVFALMTRFLGPVAGREDLVQEVFLRLIRARERYRPTARLSTLLYRMVFNLCTNERERRAGRGTVSLEALSGQDSSVDWADEDADAPPEELARGDTVRAVRRAIMALPRKQRMALILAKYEELPYVEIAAVLGSSEKAIKSMIHRARENLRATLAPFLQEELA